MKVEATAYRAPSVRGEKDCFDAGVKGRPSHRPRFQSLLPYQSRAHPGVSRALESRNDKLPAYAKTVGLGTLNIRSSGRASTTVRHLEPQPGPGSNARSCPRSSY